MKYSLSRPMLKAQLRTMKRMLAILGVVLLVPWALLSAQDTAIKLSETDQLVEQGKNVARHNSLLPTGWDPALAGDEVMKRLVKVTASQVKGAHDAEFVCVDERAYIVEHDNDIAPGHGAGAAMYCVLTVVNLKKLQVEKTHLLAKAGQTFANIRLPEAQVFVPRIIRKDKQTLRTYFCSKSENEQTWYRDFDLRTQSFEESIHKAKLKTAAGTSICKLGIFTPMQRRRALQSRR